MSTPTAQDLIIKWARTRLDRVTPRDDELRERMLVKALEATAFGVCDQYTILIVPDGKMLITVYPEMQAGWIDYIRDGSNRRMRFWIETSRIRSVGDRLRDKPEMRGDFNTLISSEIHL